MAFTKLLNRGRLDPALACQKREVSRREVPAQLQLKLLGPSPLCPGGDVELRERHDREYARGLTACQVVYPTIPYPCRRTLSHTPGWLSIDISIWGWSLKLELV
jgi:hypothetical protein